jgi:hypothetical protein
MQTKRGLQVIGVILLVIGSAVISANFFAPHTTPVDECVQVPHEISTITNEVALGSKTNVALEDNGYVYFPAVHISEGQTLKIKWYTGWDSVGIFIFTPNQFSDFLSNPPDRNSDYKGNYMARESGGRGNSGATFLFNASKSGDYVVLLYTIGRANVGYFNESILSYNYHTEYVNETQSVPQNDNLYLYAGVVFAVSGISALLTSRLPKSRLHRTI